MSAKKLIGAAALALLMTAGAASAQTGTTSTTTPGTPSTGAGDVATNALVLGAAAAIALGGVAYLARRYQAE